MESKTFTSWGTLLILAFVWGSSFILMDKALHTGSGQDLMDPLQVAIFRLSISGLCLLPFAIQGLRKLDSKSLFWIALVGILGNGIPAFLFPLAQTKLASGFAGMLNSLTPIFAFLIAVFVFKSKIRSKQIIGLFIGLVGAVGLIIVEKGVQGEFSIKYSLYIVLATLCYGISVSIMHFKLKEVRSIYVAAVALLFVALPASIYILSTNQIAVFKEDSLMLEALGYVGLLSVFGTAIALALFNRLVQKTDSLFASTVTYIIPIFAAIWGIIYGEQIGVMHALFGVIIIYGVYMVNRK